MTFFSGILIFLSFSLLYIYSPFPFYVFDVTFSMKSFDMLIRFILNLSLILLFCFLTVGNFFFSFLNELYFLIETWTWCANTGD